MQNYGLDHRPRHDTAMIYNLAVTYCSTLLVKYFKVYKHFLYRSI